MGYGTCNAKYALAALLLCALPLMGQLEIGDNTSMKLSGDVSFGYDGGFGQTGVSSHGISAGGEGFLNGYYYDPKFLSFDIHPYYNRSQSNSAYQSISNASGLTASSNLFSGSHFPGSISFNKNYNSSGTFGLPGSPGLTTHGNGQGFAINWSELLPHMPSVFAGYTVNHNTSSIYGENGQNRSNSKVLDLHSDYKLVGFGLRGFFQHQNSDASFPGFLAGETAISLETSSNSYGVSADHALPFHGQAYGGWRRTSANYDFAGGNTNASTDYADLHALLLPVTKLSLSAGVSYTSNLSAALEQQIVNAGGVPSQALSEFASHSTQYNATAGYQIYTGLYAQGQVTRLSQNVGGREFSNTLYGALVTYNKVQRFLGGFTLVIGVFDNTNQDGHVGTSLISNLGYSRRIDGWDLTANFSYSQQVQTLLATYTTSSYGYGASMRRRIGFRTYWSATFTGGHSGLNQFSGYSNRTESFSTSLTHNGYALSAGYSQSGGNSLLTYLGLVQTPVPGPVAGNQVMFDGAGWSVGASASPLRKMQVSGTFARSLSNTLSPTNSLHTYSNVLNAQFRYPIRKLYFTAGYTRFQQGLGTVGAPADVTTYYFGLSRWFNIF